MKAVQQFEFEELDEATKQYLRSIWRSDGKGTPGVYAPLNDWLPLIGFFTGLVLVGITLFFTWAPLDNPLQTTFLQTAGLLLGGWLMVAAIRVWVSRESNSVGHFIYADPSRLWAVRGGKVEVTSLEGILETKSQETFNNEGAYQSTQVQVSLPQGVRSLAVPNAQAAARLVGYLQVLSVMPTSGPEWENLTLAERGKKALEMAGEFYDPKTEDQTLTIPPPPRSVGGKPGRLLLALLLTLVVGVALFFGLFELNLMTRDHAIFDLIKNQQPHELRMYLLDPRTTRYRERVKGIIRDKYEQRIANLQREAEDPQLAVGMAGLLDAISWTPLDIVTLRVVNKTNDPAIPNESGLSPESLQKHLAEQLTTVIGDKMIQIFSPPGEVPAMIEWTYQGVPLEGNNQFQVKWTMTFRRGPDEEIFQTVTGESGPGPLMDLGKMTRQELERVGRGLVGSRFAPVFVNQFKFGLQ